MATRRGRREPVSPARSLRSTSSNQGGSSKNRKAPDVALRGKDKKGSKDPPPSANPVNVTPNRKTTSVMPTEAETDSSVRRSSRQRKSLSALELLGKKIKKEPVDDFAGSSSSNSGSGQEPGNKSSKTGKSTAGSRQKVATTSSPKEKEPNQPKQQEPSKTSKKAATPSTSRSGSRRSTRGQTADEEEQVKISSDVGKKEKDEDKNQPDKVAEKEAPATKPVEVSKASLRPTRSNRGKVAPSEEESSTTDVPSVVAAPATPSRSTRSKKLTGASSMTPSKSHTSEAVSSSDKPSQSRFTSEAAEASHTAVTVQERSSDNSDKKVVREILYLDGEKVVVEEDTSTESPQVRHSTRKSKRRRKSSQNPSQEPVPKVLRIESESSSKDTAENEKVVVKIEKPAASEEIDAEKNVGEQREKTNEDETQETNSNELTLDPESGVLVDADGNVVEQEIPEQAERAEEKEIDAGEEVVMALVELANEQEASKQKDLAKQMSQDSAEPTRGLVKTRQPAVKTIKSELGASDRVILEALEQIQQEGESGSELVEEEEETEGAIVMVVGENGQVKQKELSLEEVNEINEIADMMERRGGGSKAAEEGEGDGEDGDSTYKQITNLDLTHIELSRSGRRAKPQNQVIMTPYLQQLVKDLKPDKDCEMDCHVTVVRNPVSGKRISMQCNYCDKLLTDNHDFRRHIKSHPEVDFKPWKCPLCDYKSQIKASIGRHINVHSSIKPYTCTECGRNFTFKQKLLLHMKYHADIRDYLCPMCDFSFHELKTLKNHVLKIHKLNYNDIRGKVAIRQKDVERSLAEAGKSQEVLSKDRPQLLKWVIDEESGIKVLVQTPVSATSTQQDMEPRRVINIVPLDTETDTADVTGGEKEAAAEGKDAGSESENAAAAIVDRVKREGAEKGDGKDEEEEGGEENKKENQEGHTKGIASVPHSEGISQVAVKQGGNSVMSVSVVTEEKQPEGSTVVMEVGEDGKVTEIERTLIKKEKVEPGKESKPRRPPKLSGPLKTIIQTRRFKQGLPPLPKKPEPRYDPVTGRRKRFVNNQRCLSQSQVETALLEYCQVDVGMTPHKISFKCKLCEKEDVRFPSKTQFTAHLESVHPDIRPWACQQCGYSCRLRSSLIAHMKIHNGARNFSCDQCSKTFLFKQKLREHMRYHLNLREYKCSECEKAFNSKQELTRHMNRRHDYSGELAWICAICNKGFKSAFQLQRHIDTHAGHKKFLCQYCQKYYRSKTSLIQHMKSHTCMFHCEICDRNYGSYSGFMAHKVMHDESYEGYKCDLCEKVMHTKGSLKRHREVSHSTERPFDCDECSKNFKTKKDLKNHMVVHLSTVGFTCEVCQFTCKRYESLRVHMRRHADVKPFQCGICGKEYTQKHALETHLRHHTGVQDGVCRTCGESFTTKLQYDLHMKQHLSDGHTEESVIQDVATDGMTVFMCEECNSVFLTQDNLAVHILAAHMKQGWSAGGGAEGQGGVEHPGGAEGGVGGGTGAIEAQAEEVITESEVHDGIYGDNQMVVEFPQHEESLPPLSGHHRRHHIKPEMQEAVETLVTISDPNSQQRTVTLIHPSPSKPGNITTTEQSMEVESEEIVGEDVPQLQDPLGYSSVNPNVEVQNIIDFPQGSQGEHLVIRGEGEDQETFVTFTDPNTNQEYMLAVESDAIANLLSTTVAIETENGEQGEQQYVAVAETVEIAEGSEGQKEKETASAKDATPSQAGTGDAGEKTNVKALGETPEEESSTSQKEVSVSHLEPEETSPAAEMSQGETAEKSDTSREETVQQSQISQEETTGEFEMSQRETSQESQMSQEEKTEESHMGHDETAEKSEMSQEETSQESQINQEEKSEQSQPSQIESQTSESTLSHAVEQVTHAESHETNDSFTNPPDKQDVTGNSQGGVESQDREKGDSEPSEASQAESKDGADSQRQSVETEVSESAQRGFENENVTKDSA